MKKLGYKIALILVVSASFNLSVQAQGKSVRPPVFSMQGIFLDVAGLFN
tara:strand:- start:2606 stop:2752 length:147 start_codon:yes stop_codon:yes gene_type:complete